MSSKGVMNEEPVLEALRARRLASGLDIDAVATLTGLHKPYLELLEKGQVDLLPPGIDQRSFVKAYLGAIGIEDSAQIDRWVDALLGEVEPKPASTSPAPARPEPAGATAEVFGPSTHSFSWQSTVKAVSAAIVLLLISMGFAQYFLAKKAHPPVEGTQATSLRPDPGPNGYVTAVEPIHPRKEEIEVVPLPTSAVPAEAQSAAVVDARAADAPPRPAPPPPAAQIDQPAAVLKSVAKLGPPKVQIPEPPIPEPKLPLPVVPEPQVAPPVSRPEVALPVSRDVVVSAQEGTESGVPRSKAVATPKDRDQARLEARFQRPTPPPQPVESDQATLPEPVKSREAPTPVPAKPDARAEAQPQRSAPPAEPDEAAPAEPKKAPPAEPKKAASAKPAAPAGGSQKVLRATDEVWLMVVHASGESEEMTLAPGEEVTVSDSDSVVIGNAGGVEVTVDGKLMEPLGEKGEVRRLSPKKP